MSYPCYSYAKRCMESRSLSGSHAGQVPIRLKLMDISIMVGVMVPLALAVMAMRSSPRVIGPSLVLHHGMADANAVFPRLAACASFPLPLVVKRTNKGSWLTPPHRRASQSNWQLCRDHFHARRDRKLAVTDELHFSCRNDNLNKKPEDITASPKLPPEVV